MTRRLGIWVAAWLIMGGPSPAAEQPPRNFVLHATPKPVPAIGFEDEQGHAQSLTDFKGKVVLLNVWATWCGPCREEMPELERLQVLLGGADFAVVALSIDRYGPDAVRKFYAQVGVKNLTIQLDAGRKAIRELDVVGAPTTLLIDRQRSELGRVAGPAEWDAPDVVDFLRHIISRRTGAVEPAAAEPQSSNPGKRD